MVAVPSDIPLTNPTLDTLAILVSVLLHVKPVLLVVNGFVLPTHTNPAPDMLAGNTLTVSVAVRRQPLVPVYDITVLPPISVFTSPVPPLIVATVVLLLDQVPPDGLLVYVAELSAHIVNEPTNGAGIELTVASLVIKQPVGKVYVIVVVLPDNPRNKPLVDIVPTAVLLLDHVPPDGEQ
jgi:hypothetical protein